MKIMALVVLLFLCIPLAQAKQCMFGAMTGSKMRLAYDYKSQAATSFRVSCDHAYSIRFNSLNLRDSTGNSFVSNGSYKLRTRMNISGPVSNLWNTPIPQQAGLSNKYVIFVQLEERPIASTPAGRYTDQIYIDLSL